MSDSRNKNVQIILIWLTGIFRDILTFPGWKSEKNLSRTTMLRWVDNSAWWSRIHRALVANDSMGYKRSLSGGMFVSASEFFTYLLVKRCANIIFWQEIFHRRNIMYFNEERNPAKKNLQGLRLVVYIGPLRQEQRTLSNQSTLWVIKKNLRNANIFGSKKYFERKIIEDFFCVG